MSTAVRVVVSRRFMGLVFKPVDCYLNSVRLVFYEFAVYRTLCFCLGAVFKRPSAGFFVVFNAVRAINLVAFFYIVKDAEVVGERAADQEGQRNEGCRVVFFMVASFSCCRERPGRLP